MKHNTPNPMNGDIEPRKQLYALGTICGLLQCAPDKILTIAEASGVEPHWYIDGVPYFRGDALQTMFDYAQAVKRQIVESN
jgi:hypothetical protein